MQNIYLEIIKKPLEIYLTGFTLQVILYVIVCVFLLLVGEKVNYLLFGQKTFASAFQYGLVGGFGFLLIQSGRSFYRAEERSDYYVKTLWIRQISIFAVILLLFLSRYLNFQTAVFSLVIIDLIIGIIIGARVFKDLNFNELITYLPKQFDVIEDFLHPAKWLIAYFLALTA